MSGGERRTFPVRVVGRDASTDIALLRVGAEGGASQDEASPDDTSPIDHPVRFATDPVSPGASVFVAGVTAVDAVAISVAVR